MSSALFIRLSSIGDLYQCAFSAEALLHDHPHLRIVWLVRSDLAGVLEDLAKQRHWQPRVEIVAIERTPGLRGVGQLLRLACYLAGRDFQLIYDAHNSLRSHLIRAAMAIAAWRGGRASRPETVVRPKSRWRRFLYFRFNRRSVFASPFRGAVSYLEPLQRADWLAGQLDALTSVRHPPTACDAQVDSWRAQHASAGSIIGLAPSAAWPMKTWPESHWQELIAQSPSRWRFVVLGGPGDRDLAARLVATDSNRCLNLTGERALAQTSAVLSSLDLLVSADTGLFHAADHLGVRALGLMGPTAFGFPTRPTSSWISLGLTCQPCSKDGRGRCTNTTYQRCLVEITPTRVIDEIRQRLM